MTHTLSARRYLAVHLPLLPSERVKRSVGSPPDAPFALVEKAKSALRLAALDAEALGLGLEPGLTLADARARVPGLVAFDHAPGEDAALLAWLADACSRYTPSVAIDPPDGLILDITGCTHRYENRPQGKKKGKEFFHTKTQRHEDDDPLCAFVCSRESSSDSAAPLALAHDLKKRLHRLGLTARLALAPTPDAAAALARYGGADMRALPVAALGLDAQTVLALKRAGLKTIGALADRPRAPLAARFGRELPDRLSRLLGEDDVRITPRRLPEAIVTEARFAEPVARTEDALATLANLVAEAAVTLGERGEGGRRFEASLFRSDGHVARLAVETGMPTRDPALVDRLFAERIDALADPLDPGFGYDLIRLAVPIAERLAPGQLALEGGQVAEAELALLLDRLATRLGRRNVRRFARADTHIPEQAAFDLPVSDAAPPAAWPPPAPGEPPLRPLHLFDPPQRIDVIAEVPDGPPRRFRWRRGLHEITRAEGPERIAAEWWRRKEGAGPTRDYYRVEDAHGRRFWVFRHGLYNVETTNPDWYVHGLFA